ncbi:MAG: FG-GAP repeat protein [Myxococcales bacterium]|nr:FG-GAP repeat protein [Myxococcales bacterium]
MVRRALWLGVLAAGACKGPAVVVEPLPTPPDPPTTGPTPVDCEPLTLRPDGRAVPPLGLVQLVPTGGSGDWQFTVVPPEAGEVDPSTWAFLASEVPGPATITVTDASCEGSASVGLEVLTPFSASPEAAAVAPGAVVTPTWTGGSGDVVCSMDVDSSGAGLSGCTYTAGSTPGQDVLRVTDPVMGTFHDVRIDVVDGLTFVVAGHEGVVIPMGSTTSGRWIARASSGSGVLDPIVLDGPFAVSGGGVEATGPGAGSVQLIDRHTGDTAVVPVRSVMAVSPLLARDGERSGQGVALPLGDVNGDGYPDAAVGFIEPGIDHHYGGSVAVHRGGPGGLNPVADQVFAGGGINWTLGRSVAVGDVDGDGLVDLLMGADRADSGATNNGIVEIHRGVQGAFFETDARVLIGEIPFGRFGTALAVCDFDGDGWNDLAVGAQEASDLATALPAEDQGAVQVFWGGPNGYSDRPDFEIFGRLQGPTGWEPAPFLGLGASLAAADFDGDGLCDLAAGAPDLGVDGELDGGSVFLYAGRDDGSILTRDPVRVLAGPPGEASQFGRRLSAGEVDGDGRADLLVAAWRAGAESQGAVYLYGGTAPLDAVDPIPTTAASWAATGADPFDFFGSDARLDDMDGNLRADVVVGAYRAQTNRSDQGKVYAFVDPPMSGVVVSSTGATFDVDGASAGDRLGQAVAGLGDMNLDGTGDFVALAGYSNAYGIEVGAPFFASGGDDGTTQLSLAGVPSGHQIGQALTRVDVDGDGDLDLVFGAPDAGVPTVGGNAGAVFAAAAQPDGSYGPPTLFLGGHPTHSGSDRFGHGLAVSDFDGDGFDDLVVVARTDSRLGFPGVEFNDAQGCGDALSLTGSLWVYRGSATGIDPTASFAWFGPLEYGNIERVAGGFDHDGDGFDDLVVGSTLWDDVGGFAVLRGRPYVGPGIDLFCDAPIVKGNERFDRLGVSLAPMGDLDGDGCDELAVGASGEEFGRDWNNQGSVRVFWGSGGAGCASEPLVSTLQLEVLNTRLGVGLASGDDVDGDGVNDLIAGGDEYRVYFAEHGAAWMVPGSWILQVPRQPWPDDRLPLDSETQRAELLPFQGLDRTYGLVGRDAAGRYGGSVGIVRVQGEPLVAIAAPLGGQGGVRRAGGIELHRWTDAGLETPAARLIVGEIPLEGRFGSVMSTFDDHILVGAPTSGVEGLTVGAVYPVAL